jgi:flagellar M-ring protein FliF
LKSLAFEPIAIPGDLGDAADAAWMTPMDIMKMAQVAVLAVVALILGLFVVRPILAPSGRKGLAQLQADARPLALPPAVYDGQNRAANGALTGEIQDGFDATPFSTRTVAFEAGEEPVADPVTRLRRLIEERQTESIEILRSWMEKEEEKT